ncbi:hypothetical protein CLOM_g18573 [Closterium sp. NIES-68]|nr:hypothetical protein CLOM_g18573 [Closterium sp. NIES-68]GJP81052.1 hypothetical protein CLOP_g11231 [Closterium sp. NIES-67]
MLTHWLRLSLPRAPLLPPLAADRFAPARAEAGSGERAEGGGKRGGGNGGSGEGAPPFESNQRSARAYGGEKGPGRTSRSGGRERRKAAAEEAESAGGAVADSVRRNAQLTAEALRSKSRRAKRWLGQHYMLHDDISRATVAAAAIQRGDLVLEVGPGTGALTAALVEAGAHVIAVEKDPDMVQLVRERFAHCPQVEVVHADILKWPVQAHLAMRLHHPLRGADGAAAEGRGAGARGGAAEGARGTDGQAGEAALPLTAGDRLPAAPAPGVAGNRSRESLGVSSSGQRAKVVTNLPFNITTDFLRLFLPLGHLVATVVCMLQDEAAQRLVDASPAPSQYRPMSVFVTYYADPTYQFFVSRRSFLPPPNVDAAVVSFALKPPMARVHVASPSEFFNMVNMAFQAKRKMLRSSLQPEYSSERVSAALEALTLPATARPEELSFQQFVLLFGKIHDQ